MQDPSGSYSINVDGTDQSAYGYPHFTATTEDLKGDTQ